MHKTVFAIALTAALALATAAPAGPITLKGDMAHSTSGLGDFTATLSYSASDATNATLTLAITNTTSPGNGGYLTGFVFNNPGNAITGVASLTTNYGSFTVLGGPGYQNGVNGAPYGQFDLGAALGGSFEGGGSPNSGIAVGATGNFEFALTGVGLNSLTTASFLSELSTGPGQGQDPAFFVARFRGMSAVGDAPTSDKVPAQDTPEPSALLLAALGVGLLGWRSRRKA